MSRRLSTDERIQGHAFRAGTVVEVDDAGRLSLVRLEEPHMLGGVRYGRLAGEQVVSGVRRAAESHVRFFPDGSLSTLTPAEDLPLAESSLERVARERR